MTSGPLPRVLGSYTLLSRIGTGGMAEVFLAQTQGLAGFEKVVALKLIHSHLAADEHFVRMLVEEAKIVVLLNHSNIAQIFDLGRVDDNYYIVMEYVEGAPVSFLQKAVARRGQRLPISAACHIAAEVCNGLDYAHRKRDSDGRPLNIVHRDVSPQNVLLSYAGEIKIVDFGIAKANLRSEGTEVGVIKGNYYYMSPEQAWADPTDRRSDVFSTGVLLYEMLVGEMLYKERSIPDLIARVREARFDPPEMLRPEVSPQLSAIVMRALARDPSARFQSALDMGEALRDLLYQTDASFNSTRLARIVRGLAPPGWQNELEAPVAQTPTGGAHSSMRPGEFGGQEDSVLFAREDLLAPVTRSDGPAGQIQGAPLQGEATARHLKPSSGEGGEQSVAAAEHGATRRFRGDERAGLKPSPSEIDRDDDRTLVEHSAALRSARAMLRLADLDPDSAPSLPGDDEATGAHVPVALGRRAQTGFEHDEGVGWQPARSDSDTVPPPRRASDPHSLMPVPSLPGPAKVPSVAAHLLENPRFSSRPPDSTASSNQHYRGHAVLPGTTPSLQAPRRSEAIMPPPSDNMPPSPTVPPTPPLPDIKEAHALFRGNAQARRERWAIGGMLLLVVGLIALGTWLRRASEDPAFPRVEVLSEPSGAGVRLDGVLQGGRTPLELPAGLAAGETHRLQLGLPGYQNWQNSFEVSAGSLQVIAVLKPLRTQLSIDTEPTGAVLTIDGVERGVTPLTLDDLVVGQKLQVRVQLVGFQPSERAHIVASSDAGPGRLELKLTRGSKLP